MSNSQNAIDETMWSGLLHTGIAGTVFRLPHVPPTQKAVAAAKLDVGFLGFPFDSTQISRTGANYGPRGIREHSSLFLTYNATSDIDLAARLTMADCGDVPVIPGNVSGTMDRAEALCGEILKGGARPFILGGDHSVTIGGARAFARQHKRPGLILLDTHFDTADDVGGVKESHCCPITRAIDAGFDPKCTAIIGVSGWLNPRSEMDYARKQGMAVFTLDDVMREGATAIGKKAAAVAGADGRDVYLTIDIDVLDASIAPATCVPTAGGMMLRELFAIIAEFKGLKIGAADIVEVAPSLDPTNVTQITACRIILETLSIMK